MKTLVVTYSFTGNNKRLAQGLAEKIEADYTELTEKKKRHIYSIVLDVIFNRTPKVHPLQKHVRDYDFVIFVAPIWFGKIATPFRRLFELHKNDLKDFAFISLSAGANGVSPNVEPEFEKYLHQKPNALIHLLISDLLPDEQRGNQKILNAYRLNEKEVSNLIDRVAHSLEKSNI